MGPRIGLRFIQRLELEPRSPQCINHGVKWTMPEAHCDGLPATLPRFAEAIGLEIVLATRQLVIHKRVVRGENQAAALGQQTGEFRKGMCPVWQIVHDKGGKDQIEATIVEGQRFVQIRHQQSRPAVKAALCDLEQSGT